MALASHFWTRFLQGTITICCILQPLEAHFTLKMNGRGSMQVDVDGIQVIDHSPESPFLFVGNGQSSFRSHLGNFIIDDYVKERIPLTDFDLLDGSGEDGSARVEFHNKGLMKTVITFKTEETRGLDDVITFESLPADVNHLWVRLWAQETEHVYGGGEQFSYLDLRGHVFPLWIQEQGVGRNKSTLVTFKADQLVNGGGGDYYTTYWVQPTFTSSRLYACHFDITSYSEFDFRHPEFHEVQIWGQRPGRIHFGAGESFIHLVGKVTGFFGRQPVLPSWTHDGAILGVQGGTSAMLDYLRQAQGNSTLVTGLWIQDWVGLINTSFGSRLFWNWVWDKKHYPNLDKEIVSLRAKGVRVLAYINPNLNREGSLFKEASSRNLLVRNATGHTYIVDFGEFFCGIVDLTNPATVKWYKGVIRKNMVELGFGGWMADFGEYLPTDAVFHSGESGEDLHNKWPVLWAKLNREVVREAGMEGQLLIWMRAGFSGSQNYTLASWAGDQLVDFSLSDGLASVIPAALSLGMSGFGLSHFDIGGYTSVFGIDRTKELLLRYAEFAAFTPIMRTHEGNRPKANWQFYSSRDTTLAFARHTKIFHMLGDYTRAVVRENAKTGVPAQRPLFMHYANDKKSYSINYEYLYGRDLLVAPVYREGMDTWSVYLPHPEDWVFLWGGQEHGGGRTVTVPAPLGKIPVFYRKSSRWTALFKSIAKVDTQAHPEGLENPGTNSSAATTGFLKSCLASVIVVILLLLFGQWYWRRHLLRCRGTAYQKIGK